MDAFHSIRHICHILYYINSLKYFSLCIDALILCDLLIQRQVPLILSLISKNDCDSAWCQILFFPFTGLSNALTPKGKNILHNQITYAYKELQNMAYVTDLYMIGLGVHRSSLRVHWNSMHAHILALICSLNGLKSGQTMTNKCRATLWRQYNWEMNSWRDGWEGPVIWGWTDRG